MDYLSQLDRLGCAIEPVVLASHEMQPLAEAADQLLATSNSPAGVRGLFQSAPAFAALEHHPGVRRLVDPVLGCGAFVTRSILFDKRPEANWDVVWHQDKTIAVQHRIDAPGFGPWSTKSGVAHVQPPPEVLARMVTIRLHLDDCGSDNGPLLVIRGSHKRLLPEQDIAGVDWERHPERAELPAPRGSALVMRPLILHASRKSTNPRRRRVIHMEFAADPLPCGLQWARL